MWQTVTFDTVSCPCNGLFREMSPKTSHWHCTTLHCRWRYTWRWRDAPSSCVCRMVAPLRSTHSTSTSTASRYTQSTTLLTYLLTFLDLVFPVIAGTEGPGGWLHANRERKCADTIGTVLGWPYLMIKYKYIFQIKYTEAVLSNSTRKLLWFEIVKCWLNAVLKNEYIVLFIIIFGTLVVCQ